MQVAAGDTGKSSACIRQYYSTEVTARMVRRSFEAPGVDGFYLALRYGGHGFKLALAVGEMMDGRAGNQWQAGGV